MARSRITTLPSIHLAPSQGRDVIMGGGIEGAERNMRETVNWRPSHRSPDSAINIVKSEADARSVDMAMNDGITQGAIRIQKNSIVGAMYRLNAKPDYRVIYGKDSEAAAEYGEELASVAEARFNLASQSEDCHFDAGGMMTFTDQVRLVVGSCVLAGEAFGTPEWLKDDLSRPFKTAIQMVTPARVSNKDDGADENYPGGDRLRRGILMDRRGRPKKFFVRRGHPNEWHDLTSSYWDEIPAALPWGRRQMIFVREAMQIDQTRGLSEMVAALSHIRMTKKFSEVTLQNAVVNASYAAAIESELPNHEVIAAMGGGTEGWMNAIGQYMMMLEGYLSTADNIAIDGAKMPHLFPGTKLNLTPMGTPGGIGSDFQAGLIRHTAAALGVSPADLSRDFARVNYSGLKGELAIAERDMAVKKESWANRWATAVYRLWFEEEMAAGNLPLPPGRNRTDFYRPLMKDAYTRCMWIGTGRGQIDEMKETQAALLRIAGGLSTYEKECARTGEDYREVFAQRRKENRLMVDMGLSFQMSTTVAADSAGNGGNQNQPKSGKTGSADDGDDE
jgi:lambda family phage portal protein